MGRKRLRVDLETWDIFEAAKQLATIDGAEGVLQDIALELDCFKGDMPLEPEYGSLIKGALASKRLDLPMLEQEAKRIATKHPDVNYVWVHVDKDGTLNLNLRLKESAGGKSASIRL